VAKSSHKVKERAILKLRADANEMMLLGSSEDRVQGLSGKDIEESEDDQTSGDVQGSQSNVGDFGKLLLDMKLGANARKGNLTRDESQ
jgi:hypothetical protein